MILLNKSLNISYLSHACCFTFEDVKECLCTHRWSSPAPCWSQRTHAVCWQSRHESQSPQSEPAGWTAGCCRADSWWSIRCCSSGRLYVWCSDTAVCCLDSSTGQRALILEPGLHSDMNRAKRHPGRADKAPSPFHLQRKADDKAAWPERIAEEGLWKHWLLNQKNWNCWISILCLLC